MVSFLFSFKEAQYKHVYGRNNSGMVIGNCVVAFREFQILVAKVKTHPANQKGEIYV